MWRHHHHHRPPPLPPPPCVPPIIVQPPLGPIPGVTDGSDAAPGEVGEFLFGSFITNWNLPTGTADLRQFQDTITVPPGDWDVSANLTTENLALTGGDFLCSNLGPPQLVPALVDSFFDTNGNALLAGVVFKCGPCRLSIVKPTLITFAIELENETGVSAVSPTTLQVWARRVR